VSAADAARTAEQSASAYLKALAIRLRARVDDPRFGGAEGSAAPGYALGMQHAAELISDAAGDLDAGTTLSHLAQRELGMIGAEAIFPGRLGVPR